jgi:hypothetical protein
MKKFAKHLPHYISLLGILAASVLAFYLFSSDKLFLIGTAVAAAAAYFSWGIIHHLLHGDLNLSIIIEYLAVSVLGVILVLSLLFRS